MSSRKIAAVTLCLISCFVLTKAASATDTVDFSNSGGTLSGSKAGLSLSGSTLIAISGDNGGGVVTGDVAALSVTIGTLNSGWLAMGGTFAAGGAFSIDGNGGNGVGNGVLFSGSFSGPVSWTLTTLANGTHHYILTGVVTGMMRGGTLNAVTVQLTINTGRGVFDGSTFLAGGNTTTNSSVAEPTSLAMFATGTLSMLGVIRRRVLS